MGYVFISYSTKNIEAALNVKNVLIQNGIDCWIAPECIEAGMNYTSAIPAAIEGCYAFVLVLSGEAQLSQWVTKELDLALNRERPIVPFHLDSSKMTDQYDFMLAGCQRIEAFTRLSEAYRELIDRLSRLDTENTYKDKVKADDMQPDASQETKIPESDHALEHVVKTISADKAAKEKKRSYKWIIPVAIGSVAFIGLCVAISVAVNKAAQAVKRQTEQITEGIASTVNGFKENYSGGVSVDKNESGNVVISFGGNDSKNDNNGISIAGDIINQIIGEDTLDAIAKLNDPDALAEALKGEDLDFSKLDPKIMSYTSMTKMEDLISWNAEFEDDATGTDGKEYENVLVLSAKAGEGSGANFILDKEYNMFLAEIICPEDLEDSENSWTVDLLIDGEVVKQYVVNAQTQSQVLTYKLKDCNSVMIQIEDTYDYETGLIIANAYLL